MYITSISLSYYFLAVAIIALSFTFYFKTLVIKTSEESSSKNQIIGNMKDPDLWRLRNNRMAYLSMVWTIISVSAFIYLKYFFKAGLIPIWYLIAYIAIALFSIVIFGIRRKASI